MSGQPLPERTLPSDSQDMTYHPPRQDMTYHPPRQDMTYHPPRQDMAYHPPRQDMTYHPPRQDMAYYPPPEMSRYFLPRGQPSFFVMDTRQERRDLEDEIYQLSLVNVKLREELDKERMLSKILQQNINLKDQEIEELKQHKAMLIKDNLALEKEVSDMKKQLGELQDKISLLELDQRKAVQVQRRAVLRQFAINVEYEMKEMMIDTLSRDEQQNYRVDDDDEKTERLIMNTSLLELSKQLQDDEKNQLFKLWFKTETIEDGKTQFGYFVETMRILKALFNTHAHPTDIEGVLVTSSDITTFLNEDFPTTLKPPQRKKNNKQQPNVDTLKRMALSMVDMLVSIRNDSQQDQFLYNNDWTQ